MLDQHQWDPKTPKKWEDLVGNGGTWKELAANIRGNTCPHIVLCGPAGCGKSLFTTLVLEGLPVLTIECTANAGLRDMRDGIRGFARGSRTGKGDYRWVVLQHADALAGDTQAFLRRMMETTSHSTRFLFECADAGAISEPILSRSGLFVVNAPTESEISYEIQRRTGYTLVSEAVEAIVKSCSGNIRNAMYMALAAKWNGDVLDIVGNFEAYKDILEKRKEDWTTWAIYAEKECRLRGLDCRDLLMFGWPMNPHVAYMRNQWSRLGGISSRALFFRAINALRQNA
jgi:DNA polymerase III delta prime subunit